MKNVNPLRTKDVNPPLAQALLSWKIFQQPLCRAPAAKARIHSNEDPKETWDDHGALEFLSFLGEEGHIHVN